jgi:predicted MFS family arabinose efflux permease
MFFGRMRTEGRERDLMFFSALTISVATALLLFRVDLVTVVLVAVLIGLATGPYDIALFTVRQRRTDAAWLGRAFAVSMAANFVGFPLGSALGGVLTTISMQLAILASVGFTALASVLLFALVPKRVP